MNVLSKLVVPAAILAIATATARAADDNEVLIGAATSFSGWMAAFDTSPTHAAEIAIQDINAAGGVLGRSCGLFISTQKPMPLRPRVRRRTW